MTLFQTSDEQRVHLYRIASLMADAGLPAAFVTHAVEIASASQGVYELMALWSEFENDLQERENVIADIQDAIDEDAERPRRT